MVELEPTYTVFVRVPIPRAGFVDPPPVEWGSAKDEALWRILSGAAQREIDWNQVAYRFDIPVDFLLQQVAYLTERHASQVRAQVRKATAAAKGSAAPSPTPGSDPAVGSNNVRPTSAASVQRGSPRPRKYGSSPGTPLNTSIRPVISRNASTSTAVLREGESSSPRPTIPGSGRGSDNGGRRRLSSLPVTSTPGKSPPPPQPESKAARSPSPDPADSSSSSTSEDDSAPAESRIIRRPPRFRQQDTNPPFGEDDGDESEPAFQPYQAPSTASVKAPSQDLTSTVRGDAQASTARRQKGHKVSKQRPHSQSQTSDSSMGSAPLVRKVPKTREQRASGPLSPHRPGEPAKRSPGGAAKGYSREGSEGTPSMGSSFSDLDDASVTQSALEEQMASHMNRGAGSRFSISQAFRNRYGPNSS